MPARHTSLRRSEGNFRRGTQCDELFDKARAPHGIGSNSPSPSPARRRAESARPCGVISACELVVIFLIRFEQMAKVPVAEHNDMVKGNPGGALRIYVLRPYVGFAKQYVRPESERKVYSCSVAACVITRPADPRPPQMFEIDRTCSIRENEIRKTALGDRWRERPFRYPIRDPAGHCPLGIGGEGI